MLNSFGERDVRLLWRILWRGAGFMLVDCRQANGMAGTPSLDRRLINNENDFVAWAKTWNGRGNCYVGRNPRQADGKTIERIAAISFDIDPIYDKTVGATDEQNRLVLSTSRIFINKYSGGYLASSGNGALVLYPVKNQGTHENATYQQGLRRLEEAFRANWPETSTLDQTYDNARLIRLIGTVNVKGSHRLSKFVQAPQIWETPAKILQEVIELSVTANTSSAEPSSDRSNEPWVATLLAGVGDGQRHTALVRLSGYFLAKHPEDVAFQMLVSWNTHNQPPIEEREFEETFKDIARRFKTGEYEAFSRLVQEESAGAHTPSGSLETYEKWSSQHCERPEFPTTIAEIDRYARVQRGDVYLVIARTGLGKSTFATDLARQFIRNRKRVLFFSTEMNFSEVWERYWAQDLMVPASSIHDHRLNGKTEMVERYKKEQFVQHPFVVYDQPTLNIGILEREIDTHRPDAVFLDYLQYIDTGVEHRPSELARIVKGIKDIARRKNVAFIVTAGAADKRDWKSNKVLRTNMTDISETKIALNTASSVWVLNWAAQDQEDEGQINATIELDVQKNRFGPKFKTLLRMDRSIPTFYGS